MADDQVTIRAALRDEMSRPLELIQRELAAVRAQTDKLHSANLRASSSSIKFGSGVDRIDRVSRRAAGSLARMTKIGLGAAALAAGGAATAIYKVGGTYEKSMNTFQSVTRASVSQMQAAASTARALGQDTSLFAVSAADASGAMVELAKGGLSVSEAMAAAKGTLQLAGAAQIDGAAAAQIQANALNQYRLAGSDAAMVADVLANTANAASGEITDMATSLKYVGPVANGVGENITNTATAIGLLAKNGILGDTAGTSLRGMISSLASPSKKARKGLEGLGIEAFDAQGNFKGFRSVISQLSTAQGKMTKEQFAANAVMAFGREPLAAMVALAAEGKTGFDEMAKAVSHQGGAAEVSAARTKGLTGAVEGLKSQLETVAIDLYTRSAPGLEKFVRQFTEGIPGAADTALSAIDGMALAIPGVLSQLSAGNDSGAAFSLAAMFGGDPKTWEAAITRARDIVSDLGTVARDVLVPAFADVGSQASLLLAPLGGLAGLLSLMADHTTTSRIALEVFVGSIAAYRLAVALASTATTGWAVATGVWSGVTAVATTVLGTRNTTLGIHIGLTYLAIAGWVRSSAVTVANTAAMLVNRAAYGAAYLYTWLLVQGLAVGAWIRSSAMTAANTAVMLANRAMYGIAYLTTFLVVKGLEAAAWARSTALTVAGTVAQLAARGAMIAGAAATGLVTGAQWLLNAAMTANPIGLVIAVVAGLIGAMVLLYRRSSTVRAIVDLTWQALKTAGVWLFNLAVKVGGFLAKWTPLGIAIQVVKAHWDDIAAAIGAVIDKLESVIGAAGRAKDAVAGGIGKVGDFVGGLNPFGDTGRPRAGGGSGGHTMAMHGAIDSAVPGNRRVTSVQRTYALGSSDSDHARGRAVDLIGSGLGAYRQAVLRSGGYAAFHGQGKGRHLHAAFSDGVPARQNLVKPTGPAPYLPPGPVGDTGRPRAGTSAGGGIVIMPGAVQVIVQGGGSGVDAAAIARAVEDALSKVLQDAKERS